MRARGDPGQHLPRRTGRRGRSGGRLGERAAGRGRPGRLRPGAAVARPRRCEDSTTSSSPARRLLLRRLHRALQRMATEEAARALAGEPLNLGWFDLRRTASLPFDRLRARCFGSTSRSVGSRTVTNDDIARAIWTPVATSCWRPRTRTGCRGPRRCGLRRRTTGAVLGVLPRRAPLTEHRRAAADRHGRVRFDGAAGHRAGGLHDRHRGAGDRPGRDRARDRRLLARVRAPGRPRSGRSTGSPARRGCGCTGRACTSARSSTRTARSTSASWSGLD